MAKDGITLKELATKAGVSPTTASLVLNGRTCRVSDATRQRILKVARTHAYYPHGAAQSLVTSKTKTIGYLIPDISNPFFTTMARGIEDRALDFDYNVIFCSTDDSRVQEDRRVAMLRGRGIDGLIIAHAADRTQGEPLAERLSVPVILIDRDMEMPGVAGRVLVDNVAGATSAVEHLLARGRRKIAFLGGPRWASSSKDRHKGYVAALTGAGIVPDERRVRFGAYSMDAGRSMMHALLQSKTDIDGIFCANDLIAVGAMKVLRAAGKAVPDDVSVVGFDDSSVASLVTPALTTVRQPVHDMGVHAMELMMACIEADGPARRVVLPTELIIRRSS
ncbi:MAG: LacI family DNA-binding transcriptional regulator [Saccharofermentanales bacterium]